MTTLDLAAVGITLMAPFIHTNVPTKVIAEILEEGDKIASLLSFYL